MLRTVYGQRQKSDWAVLDDSGGGKTRGVTTWCIIHTHIQPDVSADQLK